MNINISTATRGKLHAPHIVPRWELILCLWLKIGANFPLAPKVEISLSNRYVRGTLCFLSQVEWTPRDPDSKEGRISLQWLKFMLVLHLTRWRDVWIPCGDSRESHISLPHLDRGNHVTLIPREAHGIQGFKRLQCLTLFEIGYESQNHCSNWKVSLGLLPHLQKRPYCPAKPSLDSWGVHRN